MGNPLNVAYLELHLFLHTKSYTKLKTKSQKDESNSESKMITEGRNRGVPRWGAFFHSVRLPLFANHLRMCKRMKLALETPQCWEIVNSCNQ